MCLGQTKTCVPDDKDEACAPEHFLCPISREVMEDPVLIQSGMVFERASILDWFAYGNTTCPLTRLKVEPNVMQPEESLKQAINEWRYGTKATQVATATMTRMSSKAEVQSSTLSIPCIARQLLGNPSPHQTEHLLQQLQGLAWRNHSNKIDIAQHCIIPVLLKTLHSGELMCVWHAAEVLSLLSLRKNLNDMVQAANGTKIVQCKNVWKTLAYNFKRSQSWKALLRCKDDQSRERAAWTLWVACLDEESRNVLQKPKMLRFLVRMLSSCSAGSCMVAARLLRSLALIEDAANSLVSSGAVEGLVRLLYHNNRACRLAACSAVTNICSIGDGRLRQAFCNASGLPATISLIMSGDTLLRRWCARIIKSLAADKLDLDVLVDSRIVSFLPYILQQDDEQCQEFGCSAVEALAHCGQGMQQCLGRYVVPSLSRLLRQRSNTVRLMAAKVLLLLAIPTNVAHFAHSEVLQAILDLLQDTSERCMYIGAALYWYLCVQVPQSALRVSDAAAFRGLLRLLSSQIVDHQMAAARLMERLATEPSNGPLVSKVGGIHALLDCWTCPAINVNVRAAVEGCLTNLAAHGPCLMQQIVAACGGEDDLPASLGSMLRRKTKYVGDDDDGDTTPHNLAGTETQAVRA